MLGKSLVGSWICRGTLFFLVSALPIASLSRSEPPDDAPDTVLWEGAPVTWLELGEVGLLEARDFDVEIPAELSRHGEAGMAAAGYVSVTYPTGFALELRAVRTTFDGTGRAESPSAGIDYGGIWVATSVPRDVAMPHVRDVIESLATGPLSGFEARVPSGGGRDAARFFTFSGSPFFTEQPTWVCYELPDGATSGYTLTGRPWTAPTGATAIQTSIGSSSGNAPVCRSILNRIRSEASASTPFPTRLVFERGPRRRLTFTVFRSYESTSEVTAGESRLSLGQAKASGYMPSDPELDLWLARSAPVLLRFRLEQATDEQRCRWSLLDEWIVAVHLSRVERPEGGIEEDLERWEDEIVGQARTGLSERLARVLQGVTVLQSSELQSTAGGQSAGFKAGILVESLTAFLGTRSVVSVVCRGDAAVYSLFPTPAVWMPVHNGDAFCEELRRTVSKLVPVSID